MSANEDKAGQQQNTPAEHLLQPNNGPPHFPMELWNLLARGSAAAANPANHVQHLQQQQMNTGIRLPPPFNLTATIHHLLRSTTAPGGIPAQNAALLLQQFLIGQQQPIIGSGHTEVKREDLARDMLQNGAIKRELDGSSSSQEHLGTDSPEDIKNIKGELQLDMVSDQILEFGNDADEAVDTARPEDEEGGGQRQQQRRPRVGGSAAKTAEVWQFFSQKPNGEQAATCSICDKTIKATNSSTTGMIRHLRSCHHAQFHILQRKRAIKALKNAADDLTREQMLRKLGFNIQPEGSFEAIVATLEASVSAALQSPNSSAEAAPTMVAVPKHSVEALINGNSDNAETQPSPTAPFIPPSMAGFPFAPMPQAEQQQLLEQIENFKTSRPTSMERQQKKEQQQLAALALEQQQSNCADVKRPMKEECGSNSPITLKRRKEEDGQPVGLSLPPMPKPEIMAKPPNGTTPRGATAKKSRKPTVPVALTAQNVGQQPQKDVELEKEFARINEQMAIMFLVDNTEFLLDRPGFRHFMRALLPHYQMPTNEQFRAEIIPRVARQLGQLAQLREDLQKNNPHELPNATAIASELLQMNCSSSSVSTNRSTGSPLLSASSISNNSVISPSSSAEESGFHDEESVALAEHHHHHHQHQHLMQQHAPLKAQKSAEDEEKLAQMAAIRSQNISRSFTYSIDLNDAGNGGDGTAGTVNGSANIGTT